MDYLVLSEDLAKYALDDVEDGLDRLKHRQEFEPAFPDLGMLERSITGVVRERKAAERRAKEAAEVAAEEKHRRDHPDEYVPVHEVWNDLRQRMAGVKGMEDATGK